MSTLARCRLNFRRVKPRNASFLHTYREVGAKTIAETIDGVTNYAVQEVDLLHTIQGLRFVSLFLETLPAELSLVVMRLSKTSPTAFEGNCLRIHHARLLASC